MTQDQINFATLVHSPSLLKALSDLNFETPSPIQQQTIPPLREGRDVIGKSQTGSGKTAAFSLPILENLAPDANSTQALVLAPTRELAIQVAAHIETLAKYLPSVRVVILCGGQDYRPQLQSLKNGATIVVGTPGRILDHLERGTLKLGQLKTFVLDEADEMLRMGFIEDVETILSKLPDNKQMALFSATMPSRIRQIASRYLKDPISIEIKGETATVKSIEQRFLFASNIQKPEALLRVLAVEEFQGVIVFVRTKIAADEVAQLLQEQGHQAMAIHGDLTQALRERIIMQFKQGSIDILVATDVAARGLDVERVTHVINYDFAQDNETYVHRIGRTGRAGRSGVTILFVTPKESRLISNLERHTRQRMEKVGLPTDAMIKQVKQQRLLAKITERMEHRHLASYQQMIEDYMQKTGAEAKDVAAALVLMLNQDKAWEANISIPKSESSSNKGARSSDGGGKFASRPKSSSHESKPYQKNQAQEIFRVDVGRLHGVKPGNIVGAIANEAGLQSRDITGLKIHDHYSTVCLPKGMAKELARALNKAWVCGRQLKLTLLDASAIER